MTGDVFPKKIMMSDTCRYVQYFLHEDNLQRCSLYRYMDSVLQCFALGRSCWQGQLIRGAQHVVISSTVTVTALVFAVFIKCPMFSNEQCDKAPYGPVGAAWQPHSHASHSLNLFDDGFTVSLVQCIFIPNKNWQTPKNYSRCQALRFMPWADRRCKQHLWLKKKHLSEQMPTRVRAHRWPLGRHVLLKIVKRQKQHTCSVRA